MRSDPAHGFELSAEDHALLRTLPPDRALHWVRSVFGPRARVRTCQPLAGGTSSAIHGITVTTPTSDREVVLRRYVRTEWLRAEPDLAEHEARVLTLLEQSAVPAPRLLAVDPTGTSCDVPAVLMTRERGWVDWSPIELDRYLALLVDPLLTIASVAVPADVLIRPYVPYGAGRTMSAPAGSSCPDAWQRAIEIHHGPPPASASTFIHRDYHPGNLLWSGGAVSAVVDWANASIGSSQADVGHCRMNLVRRFGWEAAEVFKDAYLERSGDGAYDPYYDIVAAVGSLPDFADRTLDDFIERAVAGS